MIKILRKDAATAAIPILALTAHKSTEDRMAGYDVGVSDYEQKPVNMVRLKQKIAKLLKS